MIIKRIVAISLISTFSILIIILVIGLFVPTKTLEKLSRANSGDKTVVAVDKNGNAIEGATVKVQADGSTVVVDASGQTVTGASAAAQPIATATSTSTTTTPPSTGGTTTPPPSTGGSTSTPAPTISSFTASPSSIAYNASSTLSWVTTNATSCSMTILGAATPAAAGSKSTGALTATKTYTLTCTGAGGTSSPKSVTVTVAAAPPTSTCGTGGSCSSADITPHATASDCRSAFMSGTAGQPTKAAYQITASFITTHNGQKSGVILSKLCGKTSYSFNLRNMAGNDHKGTILSGKTYDSWIANFYLGPYN